ncbi:MAG: hypothetical protein DWQ44_13110 [Bacteroidetes bacterium]|nr:MAG: hypothetical protein DWQ33_13495 [Bacteroidota bacterium]REK05792.1 MAG: hypothetical protein DWQ39_05140 [Bacteroidota bacterium]REK31903.1 MAG: hypothetical protein DWQ44_13110 [Bacteroidota bacterium]REK49968.1 MAG: hypothetical protein DWQ48_05330 [Bacteroidota bacterium]
MQIYQNTTMKKLSAIFFFLNAFSVCAQVQDDFSDGNFNSNPVWQGDTGDFNVNASGQLQLNATIAGASQLTTQFIASLNTPHEWSFYIRQNFSPSSSNYGRVYLVSDQHNLKGPLNGYFLQFGEALSADAIELFRQDGNNLVSIFRSRDGQISGSFAFRIKVTRDDLGLWTLWADTTGGNDFVQLSYGADALYMSSVCFGFICTYTSGNRSNFYFDDVYAGPLIRDTIPPVLNEIVETGPSYLKLKFSESIDTASAQNLLNYDVGGGIGNPLSAISDPFNPASIQLNFSSSFISGQTYSIRISGIRDHSGNPIEPLQENFTYYQTEFADVSDIIFTELMFEPSSSNGLPNAEYVEILNRSKKFITLKNWTFSDGTATASFPDFIISPGDHVIICPSASALSFSPYGKVIGLNSFPTLNNDVGDHIVLRNPAGTSVDELKFSDKNYNNSSKSSGGWSIERIDTSFTCQDELNWKASVHPSGGTPGMINSVNGTYIDKSAPEISNLYFENHSAITIVFSESVIDDMIADPGMYIIRDLSGNNFQSDSVILDITGRKLTLFISFQVYPGEIYHLIINSEIKDCAGNIFYGNAFYPLAIAEQVIPGDVAINEILFNPVSGGYDFIELYNRSSKVLEMQKWRMAEAPFNDHNNPYLSKEISSEPTLFFPDEYIVITNDPVDLHKKYPKSVEKNLKSMKDLPDFNADKACVILYDSIGQILEYFSYDEDWHFPMIKNRKGVSLERISAELSVNAPSNWCSASSLSGYATPGYKNSAALTLSDVKDRVEILPLVFSPDNDGWNDHLFVRIKEDESGHLLRVVVLNDSGKKIRMLLNQGYVGTDELIVWDGLDDSGILAPMGIYIVFTEIVSPDGKVFRNKKACALNMR